MHLLKLVQNTVRRALADMVDDIESYAAMVKPTQDPKHGDYQINAAMSLAKVLGKKPSEIASEIRDKIDIGSWLDVPKVAGPGFINITIRTDWIAEQLQTIAHSDRLGVNPAENPGTYVIDYSGPNVAKPMHVGHLRSTIIGDSLHRLLEFLGHTVIADNHLGDWGTQLGMMLWGYKNILDKAAFAKDPVRELARIYVEVRRLIKGGEEDESSSDPIAEACRKETAKLHALDPENLGLWKRFMPHCRQEVAKIYDSLGVKFDFYLGESWYNSFLPEVLESLIEAGVASSSEDAIVVFYGEKDSPAIVRKRDGGYTYMATDLATIKYRVDVWNPTAIIYVVDSRQSLHFKQLFDAARRWGFNDIELTHVAFGSVLGEDHKPIKTRDGGAVELETLLREGIDQVKVFIKSVADELIEKMPEISYGEFQDIAQAVGVGAIKYADLSQNRLSDYIFSWPKMLAMTGNTGTYMQYAYVRNRGIFRKAGVSPTLYQIKKVAVVLDSPFERALGMQILRLEEALAAAVADYQPSQITTYLWDLAKTYSGFFQNCPVLKAETPELKESRLLLCDLTARVIQLCLGLLGIRTVERM